MKKLFFWIFLGFTFISCNKEKNNSDIKTIYENALVSNLNSYQYDLGFFGDEEGAEIYVQAKHFSISELMSIKNSGKIIYEYKAKAGYTGRDYLEIITHKGFNGNKKSIVKITLHVTE